MSEANDFDTAAMCGMLHLFTELENGEKDQDWLLPRRYHVLLDKNLMDIAIALGYVKFFPIRKGATGFNGYLLTPKGRLFLRKNTQSGY